MADEFTLSPDDVADIIAILEKSEYDSLDIQTGRFRLRVARSGDAWTQEWSAAGALSEAAGPAVIAEEEAIAEGFAAIRSPLPGTFYRSPQPGAPPFVNVGDDVKPDTVVAIIETMKLMNPVHAGVSGKVAAIEPQNAEPVDGNAILMRVALR
ncbi:MAG: biotin/lipoyl-containing protein [Parvularculaceae bacterium]